MQQLVHRGRSLFRNSSAIKRIRYLVGALFVTGVFIFGMLVGDGRIRIGFSSAKSENPTLPTVLDYSSVDQVYQTLKNNYDGKLTVDQLLDGMKEGLASATNDPYTEYFNATQAKQFTEQLNNSFSGIGAELGKDDQGNLIVVAPIKGFPADKAGLKPQDIITEINGESTSGMATDIAVQKIRGPKGSQVMLTIVRNHAQTLQISITRDDIKIPSVNTKMLPNGIAYMQIVSFSDNTETLAVQAANQIKQSGAKGIILDLRGDPGGRLDAAIGVASLWLPGGKAIVTEKGTLGTQTDTATGDDVLVGMPTVVLIDGSSASASEITAAALHDNNAAYLIGEKSYGKGVVQNLFNFNDGSELKVTVASWYRPNGQNINKQGITPDQTVALSDADTKSGNDPQLNAAEGYLAAH